MAKCTHQGCGKEFSLDNNVDNACQFHSGAPVFHEGLKGWSCCKKRVDDFDAFLEIPGCTFGKHSLEKPEVKETTPKQPTVATKVENGIETYGNKPAPTVAPITETPAETKEKEVQKEEEQEDDESIPVKVGTTCRRRGCGVTFVDEATSRGPESICHYHPGAPIFHEGSKGWSCCSRKVLEFDEFLKIKGCKERQGHLFVGSKKEGQEEQLVDCRMDWYQTQTNVIISIFAKNKEDTQVKFTSRAIDIDIKMKDNQRYKKHLPLFHLIDCEGSKFNALSTKVEINLKKTNGISWAALEPTKDVKTWTTFGVTGTGGTVGSKEIHYSGDSPLHLKD
ncbi:chord-domain-containing protein [Halteromyces radiatus]|uniref:chord-domain-containing protein n=1 Tax=Halteromyces radiatus TaxID=101107 RepID=UPI00221FCF16|nr:chord-domain-containing protein [Halteromyces radiatus]KAI8081381.1 chord-domain-containing protein [Halteromyces radiatus]